MIAQDLTIPTRDGIFTCRTGYLIFKDNQILLQKGTEEGGFWFMPGGRVKFQERSHDTVFREVEEEMFVKPVSAELAGIVENMFFDRGKDCHEVSFYYRVTLPDNFIVPTKDEDGEDVIFEWNDISTLSEIDLKPSIFKTRMAELKEGFTHIMHRDY